MTKERGQQEKEKAEPKQTESKKVQADDEVNKEAKQGQAGEREQTD